MEDDRSNLIPLKYVFTMLFSGSSICGKDNSPFSISCRLAIDLRILSNTLDSYHSHIIDCSVTSMASFFLDLQLFSVNSSHSFCSREGRAILTESIFNRALLNLEISRDCLLLIDVLICMGPSVRKIIRDLLFVIDRCLLTLNLRDDSL